MELSARHRQALLNALEKTAEERHSAKRPIEKGRHAEDIAAWEINDHLASLRIEQIKNALITNQIDY